MHAAAAGSFQTAVLPSAAEDTEQKHRLEEPINDSFKLNSAWC